MTRTRSRSSRGGDGPAAAAGPSGQAATWSASSSLVSARFRRVVQFVGEIPSMRAAVVGVDVQHDSERDHFPLARGEPRSAARARARILRRAAGRTVRGVPRAARAARGAARTGSDRGRPSGRPGKAMCGQTRAVGRTGARVEAPARTSRREVLGDRAVPREPHEVAVDVVEVSLSGLREARHVTHTPPAPPPSQRPLRRERPPLVPHGTNGARSAIASAVSGSAGRSARLARRCDRAFPNSPAS